MTTVRRELKSLILNAERGDDVTAQEYLMQVKNLNSFIDTKLIEKSQLDEQMCALKSVQPGEKVKSSCVDGQQKTIDKIIDLKTKIDEEVDRLVDLKAEVREKINQLQDNRFKSILINYYINNKTFEQIAEIIHYSKTQTTRMHGYALDVFEKMILNATNDIE